MSDEQEEPSATAVSRRLAPGGGGGGAWLGGPKTASSEKFGNADKKSFHLLGTDLFGNELKADVSGKLREKFEFPPFTVLNAQKGEWQDRKRAWLSLGIDSEVGRGENLLKMSDTLLEPDPVKRAAMQAARGLTWGTADMDEMRRREGTKGADAKTFGSGGPGELSAGFKAKSFNTQEWVAKKVEEGEIDGGMAGNQTGTSIFDPVLTELCYRWFCPPGGLILDPFAGGSVRGLVAGLLGFRYHGIDLRPEQIAANEVQRRDIAPDADIVWRVGDSNVLLNDAPEADFVFSCPPYGDLEQYSDDPNDLSAVTWEQFVGIYRAIIRKSVERLKPNRFACFVVGEYRDKETGLYRGFVPLTCAAFMAAGAGLYNEAILITAVGSLPIRVTKQFETSRKLGKTHQNIIICCKGDPKLAAEAIRQAPAVEGALRSRRQAPRPAAEPGLAPTTAEPGLSGAVPAPEAEVAAGALAFALTPRDRPQAVAVTSSGGSLAELLGTVQPRGDVNFVPDEPPDLSGIDEVVLNFATSGLDWVNGDRPVGLTVSTMDGKLCRFLPFAFQGGNLSEEAVYRWAREQLRNKKITNANTHFDVHMSRVWGIDLEEQGCTFSDIQHTAALLDDHRKQFKLDKLAADFLPELASVMRVDESQHASYHAAEVAAREKHTAELVWRLRDVMYPELEKQELVDVQRLEDGVIPAVVEMEKNGAPLDMELLEQYHTECLRRHDQLLREVSEEVGFLFDHTNKSWQRLFEKLGLPMTDSVAEGVIMTIDHPLVKKAHLASQYASLDSKTFKAYKENVGSDGVLRFDINQLRGDEGGTVSGRFSIGYVQQVPNHDNHFATFGDDLFPRRLFIPAPFVMDDGSAAEYLEADAMQIEQRLLVHYADNKRVIKEYEGDYERLMRGEETVSFHRVTWAMMKEYKPDMTYSNQKNFNFARQYGAKTVKLGVMMKFITAAEGEEIRQTKRWDDPRLKVVKEIESAYKRMMPEGDELLDRASHLAKSSCDEFCKRGDKLHQLYPHRGYVKTLVGRRSRFPNNYKTYIGLNRVLQGTGADIMKKKATELHRERKHTGLVLRMTVHDAVGGDARMRETKQRVSEVLNAQSFPLKVPILWSVHTGANWAACK
jgi:hypothetical protein